MRFVLPVSLGLLLALGGPALRAAQPDVSPLPVPPSGVIGMDEAKLAPQFWIARQDDPDRIILSREEIAAANARLLREDDSMHDLRALPATLPRAQVRGWIEGLSTRPTRTLYDAQGKAVPAATLDGLMDALALDAIPATQPTRYGLVVQRAALRSFPTGLRVFSRTGDLDIDRFQETAEFPGTPVAIVHASRDGQWLFVVSPRYAAWTRRENVAEGSAAEVLGYAAKRPYRVVTAASVRTVYTPERPEVSQLQLDMGTRVPLADWPADQPVNGEGAYSSHVLELPHRTAEGRLAFTSALLQKNTDTTDDYLPLTPANLIRQAFKFLGERYGWGHDFDGRDCSGFVSDVYRSMGVELPRNTSRQAVSPALDHRAFTAADGHEVRLQAVKQLQLGDLIYIPGHVMMVLGWVGDEPYVIHDTSGIAYRTAEGGIRRVKLDAVSVTPLRPLLFGERDSYIDRMTSIVRIRR
ncbi:SH3 domain-containing protein [Frateuria defendens]|uniref:C40 family peptidase n=1 Tax=Frateuria defendens TaxID=2219559 RepID=UPI00066FBD78|nr:SH3 domain-containing protein [Frateuria defendens]